MQLDCYGFELLINGSVLSLTATADELATRATLDGAIVYRRDVAKGLCSAFSARVKVVD